MDLTDWELRACAGAIAGEHGDRAPLVVAEHIGRLALAGDAAGIDVWKQIATRLNGLLSKTEAQLH